MWSKKHAIRIRKIIKQSTGQLPVFDRTSPAEISGIASVLKFLKCKAQNPRMRVNSQWFYLVETFGSSHVSKVYRSNSNMTWRQVLANTLVFKWQVSTGVVPENSH